MTVNQVDLAQKQQELLVAELENRILELEQEVARLQISFVRPF